MSGPATILYLHSSAGLYGADVQLALIARSLDPQRYRAVVVLPFLGELERELRQGGAEVVFHNLAALRRSHMNPRGVGRLAVATARDATAIAEIAGRHGAQLIHANTSVLTGALGGAKKAGIPLVQHVREIYPGPEVLRRTMLRHLSRSDALICVSHAVAAQFGHAQVIHDGLPRAIELSHQKEDRRVLGIEEGPFAVALLGRISEWKGQDVLTRALAFPELRERRVIGIVAGEPWPGEERHQQRLLALAHEIGVADRLRLVGFREDVDTVLGAADAVCVPSTRPDPLPNAALEAAAAGRPVIAADHGGLPEIVRHESTGLLVKPGSPAALADAIARLDADRALGRKLGAAAAADVRARFAPQRMGDAIQTVYDRLLRESQSAA